MTFLVHGRWWLLLGIACLLTTALALRQAHRYRLLNSPLARMTTLASCAAVLAWAAIGFLMFQADGAFAASIALLFSLLFGAALVKVFEPSNLLEQLEEYSSENRIALTAALGSPEVKRLLAELGKGPNELEALQHRLLALGVETRRVSRALRNPDLLSWFFSQAVLNEGVSVQLALWARYGHKPAGT
jgi:hypothetical protein